MAAKSIPRNVIIACLLIIGATFRATTAAFVARRQQCVRRNEAVPRESCCFLETTTWTPKTPIVVRPSMMRSLLASSSSFSSHEEIAPMTKNIVIVIPWERCLADTVRWRSETALAAARRVWPALYDTFGGRSSSVADDDHDNHGSNSNSLDWLFRKLRAIHHVLDGPAEYGLAVRLILEEQMLDEGRSDGSRGKYASRFHPQQQQQQQPNNNNHDSSSEKHRFVERQRQRPYPTTTRRRGTRPLTVGEITAHWRDDLCDTLRFRYATTTTSHDARSAAADPLQLLEDATRDILLEQQLSDAVVATAAAAAPRLIDQDLLLFLANNMDHDDDHNNVATATPPVVVVVVVTIQHEMDLPFARASLASAGIFHVDVDNVAPLWLGPNNNRPPPQQQEQQQEQQQQQNRDHPVYLLYDKKMGDDETTTVKRLLEQQPAHSSSASLVVKCVEASYRRLERYIALCDDDAHRRRHPNNINSCSSPRLLLAEWAAHPQELAAALMNPWMETVSRRRRVLSSQ